LSSRSTGNNRTGDVHVLVVDDEPDIIEVIRYNLVREGFVVSSAKNGNECLTEVHQHTPDLIILDVMMPVMDGFETCRRLKAGTATREIPIIFLTARSGERDEIEGLDLGADDYITKPISPRRLVSRVKASLRRLETIAKDPQILRVGNIVVNRSQYSVHHGDQELSLPRKEFELLAFMAARPGRVLSRDVLLNQIWGSDVVVIDRTVDVHISKLREKLGKHGLLIETVKGVGYRLRE
jgi:two-component system alkaline phosphatase synthesis response regulator PhoP